MFALKSVSVWVYVCVCVCVCVCVVFHIFPYPINNYIVLYL